MVERTESAPRGFLGGGPGRPARLLVDGQPIDPKHTHTLEPGQELVLETPGGGGFGVPTAQTEAIVPDRATAGSDA
jgi:N-methylhydantoinase B